MQVADLVLFALAGLVLVPLAVFTAEVVLSLCVRRPSEAGTAARSGDGPRTVVLIPAHNEELVIENTLRTLLPTLGPRDRALVVADNCGDATAAIARRCGADVVQRTDTVRRGKAYALEFGLRALSARPPDVVVVLDADCDVGPATVTTISRLAAASGLPVQALNLSEAGPGDPSTHVVSELGFRFKNLVRPLGLSRLGLPCQLMGTGMALPWSLAGRLSCAEAHLVEDVQLGIDLACAGAPAVFCPDVRVTSRFPQQRSAWISQRTRWEQGHLRMLFRHGPRLLLAAVRRARIDLLSLALDLCVPPLSLLGLIWLVAMAAAALAWLCGASAWPLAILAAGGCAAAAAVVGAWRVHCRERIPLAAIVSIPGYVLRKLPIYASFFVGRGERRWVRTEREERPSSPRSASHGRERPILTRVSGASHAAASRP